MRNKLSRARAPTGTPPLCKSKPPFGWPEPPTFPSLLLAHFSWKPNTPPLTNPQVDLQIPRLSDSGNYYIETEVAGIKWMVALTYLGEYALEALRLTALDNLNRSLIAEARPFAIPPWPAQQITLYFYLIYPPFADLAGTITHP
jgi:hypothetical protein